MFATDEEFLQESVIGKFGEEACKEALAYTKTVRDCWRLPGANGKSALDIMYNEKAPRLSGAEIMIIDFLRRAQQLFYLSPQHIPRSISKRPYVLLIIAMVVGVSSIRLILGWFSGEEDGLFSFVAGLFCFGFCLSGFHLWFFITRHKVA